MKPYTAASALKQIILIYLTLLIIACREVGAQDFSLNSSWINPGATDTRGDREALANAAAQVITQKMTTSGTLDDIVNSQALASMYSVLALQDILTGNKSWMEAVTSNLRTRASQIDIFSNGTSGSLRTTTNAAQWSLAFYYAYEAYGDVSFLDLAKSGFDQIYPYFITSDDASTYHAPANRTFVYNSTNGTCLSQGAGGIWWLPDVLDIDEIHTDTLGPFAVLSGYLYKATSNETYKAAGMLSTQYLGIGLMWDDSQLYVHTKSALYTCTYVAEPSPGPQGWYIQALAMWGNITSDASLTQRLRQLVSSSTRNSLWTQDNGILVDPTPGRNDSDNIWDDKAILVRGLSDTLRRFPTSTDLVPFIKAFLNVQYNELVNNAREPGGNVYSTALFGPPPASNASSGNILALDVLNAAFDMLPSTNNASAGATSSTAPTSSPSSQDASSSPASSKAGAIAGGVIGGAITMAVLLGALLWCRRRRHRVAQKTQTAAPDEQTTRHTNSQTMPEVVSVEPYTLMSSSPSHSKLTPASSSGFLDVPSTYRRADSSSESAVDSAGGAELGDEEVLTVSAFRRLLRHMVQEHTQGSAPPEYSSRVE
ncbi:unnamed protein product [Peniophora sp. CBMAI 1063]|nr:unnamed protein product [Peniophora sp. CBMAI 1063]